MKYSILILMTILLSSLTTFAQMSTAYVEDGDSSKGLRVAILKGPRDIGFDSRYEGYLIGVGNGSYDSVYGLSVGYANIPVQSIGFTSNLAYLQFKSEFDDSNAFRVDANVTFGLNELFVLKGGMNAVKFVGDSLFSDFNPALGVQAVVGVQVTPNFGFDVGYSLIKSSGSLPIYYNGSKFGDTDVNISISGLEVAAHGTF